LAYYTRVLSRRDDFPTIDEMRQALVAAGCRVSLDVDGGLPDAWTNLIVRHESADEICAVERNPVVPGSFGEGEINDFLGEIESCEPRSAAEWLISYLRSVKNVFAFQHLRGSHSDEGSAALTTVRDFIWSRGNAIIQADGEGFTNEDGYHILWQFSDQVSGTWNMAVLCEGSWLRFEMDLGDLEQRKAYFAGTVPRTAKT